MLRAGRVRRSCTYSLGHRRSRRRRPSRRGTAPTAARPPRRRDVQPGQHGSVVVSEDIAVHPAPDLLVEARAPSLPSGPGSPRPRGHVVEHDEHLRQSDPRPGSPARLPSRCPRRRRSAASRAASPCRPSANAERAAASAPDACWIRRRRRAARGKPKAWPRSSGRVRPATRLGRAVTTRIVIIGGGPAGYEAALVAAGHGRTSPRSPSSTRDGIGGACVLWDCVPSKTFIASTGVRTELRRADGLGFDIDIDDAKISLPQIHNRVKTLARIAVRRHRRAAAAGGGQRGRTAAASWSTTIPGMAHHRVQGHHARRQGRRAQGRRGADRHRRQPAGAAERGARRRANPELAPALRPHRAARTPGDRGFRRHRRRVLQRLHRARRQGDGGGQPRPDPAARGLRRRRGAGGGLRRTRRDAGEERPRRLGASAPPTGSR